MEQKDQIVTSAADYLKKYGLKTKIVTLPSGAIFKIKKFQMIDFVNFVMVPSGLLKQEDLKGWQEKTQEEREELMAKNKTSDTDKKLNEYLLLIGVSEPKLVDTEAFDVEKGELGISVIDPLDQAILLNEIVELNGLSRGYRESTRPFPGGERTDV